MLPLGTKAPGFDLPDTRRGHEGQRVKLADFAGQPLLVMFLCNHCPYVKWVRDPLAALVREYQEKGVGGLAAVGISSNDVENYPDDSPGKMTLEAAIADGGRGYSFPYVYDESQSVAKAYRAACTPDFYLFDRSHTLVYRGQFDDSRPTGRSTPAPGAGLPVTGADVRAAIEATLAGRPAAAKQVPSLGCNIKWKVGNEPEYFR